MSPKPWCKCVYAGVSRLILLLLSRGLHVGFD